VARQKENVHRKSWGSSSAHSLWLSVQASQGSVPSAYPAFVIFVALGFAFSSPYHTPTQGGLRRAVSCNAPRVWWHFWHCWQPVLCKLHSALYGEATNPSLSAIVSCSYSLLARQPPLDPNPLVPRAASLNSSSTTSPARNGCSSNCAILSPCLMTYGSLPRFSIRTTISPR
jgi:hypothetical protein